MTATSKRPSAGAVDALNASPPVLRNHEVKSEGDRAASASSVSVRKRKNIILIPAVPSPQVVRRGSQNRTEQYILTNRRGSQN